MDRQEIERLLIWQDRDVRVDTLQKQLSRLPQEIAAAEAGIKQEQARQHAAEQALKASELKRQHTEGQIADHETAIVRYKTQQLQVKKNEEYAALTHEIELQEQKISDLEDNVLEMLDQIESERAVLDALKEEVAAEVDRLRRQIAALQEQQAAAEAELDEARADAEEAGAVLTPATRKAYDYVKSQVRRAPFVVPLSEDRKCPGCHLRVSGEVESQVRRHLDHPRCDSCGRLLYWEA
ncbi:MAG: C4-type zinc ribbon domain-containing protein [Verrucomicrobiota bacterium JB022]|nr:C4-type zinc ribbon domain-containing protein [Verrucomicrobiota bacterium JB022]